MSLLLAQLVLHKCTFCSLFQNVSFGLVTRKQIKYYRKEQLIGVRQQMRQRTSFVQDFIIRSLDVGQFTNCTDHARFVILIFLLYSNHLEFNPFPSEKVSFFVNKIIYVQIKFRFFCMIKIIHLKLSNKYFFHTTIFIFHLSIWFSHFS